ncbi:hypothetical protein [uncultured Shewanella sp.]|uniref:hypothetical protein n=1 Tax=uncultured Shewanella sp. TaxID=173975 RepID=UPI003704BB06
MAMIKLLNHKPNVSMQAMVEVDVDPLAERCIILERNTYNVFGSKSVFNEQMKFRVPIEYSTKSELCIILFDRDKEFNAAIIDGVKAETINANLVKI